MVPAKFSSKFIKIANWDVGWTSFLWNSNFSCCFLIFGVRSWKILIASVAVLDRHLRLNKTKHNQKTHMFNEEIWYICKWERESEFGKGGLVLNWVRSVLWLLLHLDNVIWYEFHPVVDSYLFSLVRFEECTIHQRLHHFQLSSPGSQLPPTDHQESNDPCPRLL